jgi:hypothetical protein
VIAQTMGVGMSSETMHTPKSNRVTIRYVATIAGVSTATVSNVINGRDKLVERLENESRRRFRVQSGNPT